jgi:hypothetical protein
MALLLLWWGRTGIVHAALATGIVAGRHLDADRVNCAITRSLCTP